MDIRGIIWTLLRIAGVQGPRLACEDFKAIFEVKSSTRRSEKP